MTLCYRLKLEPDDNDTILVTSPDLPIVTYGDTEASALSQACEAAETILSSLIDAKEDIPIVTIPPGDRSHVLRLTLQTTLKIELYLALRATGLTRADLQRRLGWQRESVDRLFRLGHNSKIEQIDEAFRAIGREIDIHIRPAAA